MMMRMRRKYPKQQKQEKKVHLFMNKDRLYTAPQKVLHVRQSQKKMSRRTLMMTMKGMKIQRKREMNRKAQVPGKRYFLICIK